MNTVLFYRLLIDSFEREIQRQSRRQSPHETRPGAALVKLRWDKTTAEARSELAVSLIWRQYASAFWDDVRLDRVLPYKPARDAEDEKHVHPLQLDVIDRCVVQPAVRSSPKGTFPATCPRGNRVVPSTGECYTMREIEPGLYEYELGPCQH